jgi:hypothetical protein
MDIKMFILLGCLAVFCQNCKKEEAPKNDPVYFKSLVDLEPLTFLPDSFLCTATKEVPGLGSIPWTANGEAYLGTSDLNFRFWTYQDTINLGIREELFVGHLPIRTGKSVIHGSDYFQQNVGTPLGVYSRSLDDGDVADGFWTVDETKLNFIEITHIDLDKKQVEGRFDLYFLMKEQGTHGILYSEQINFKGGSFTARIVE